MFNSIYFFYLPFILKILNSFYHFKYNNYKEKKAMKDCFKNRFYLSKNQNYKNEV